MDRIAVTFLGTSSGTPTADRNVSSLAVTLDGRTLLFDCGEATQHQFLRSNLRSGAIEAIFISHLHGDHVYGLPGLLATLSMNGRTEPLPIHGPLGLRDYLASALRTTFHHPFFPIEVREEAPFTADGYRVELLPLDHSVRSLGWCVIEDDRPGRFDVARARALGVEEGPAFGVLQRGGSVTAGPRTIHSSDVLGPTRPGRRVVYCTDTRPCENSLALARGADLLIHESTYGNDLQTEAYERFHSSAADAARTARDAGAKRLILTHFSARYTDVAVLLAEARAIFPETEAAEDFATFTVAS